MSECHRGIVEKTQCDPACDEVRFGTVILIRRGGGAAHDLVGGFCVTDIEQLAGENAAFAPPLVGVLPPHCLARCFEYQPHRFRSPFIIEQPLNAAKYMP